MGYFDFDKKRYWDIRERDKTWFKVINNHLNPLESDCTKKRDKIALMTETVEIAQKEKEAIESQLAHDRELREKCK